MLGSRLSPWPTTQTKVNLHLFALRIPLSPRASILLPILPIPVGTLDGNSQNSQSPPRRQQPVPAQRAIFGEESPSRSPSPRRVALAVSRTGSAMSGILHNGSRSSSVVSGGRRGSVMSDVDYYGIFPGSSLFYTGTTPSPTKDEHQHVELVDEDVLGPDDPIPTVEGPSDLPKGSMSFLSRWDILRTIIPDTRVLIGTLPMSNLYPINLTSLTMGFNK